MRTLPRRSLALAAVALVAIGGEMALRSAMAEGEIAHALLGAGNAMPPLGAAALAGFFVLVRVSAYLLAPGLLLAASAGIAAHVVVGPSRGDQRAPASGSRKTSGTGISVAAGTGTSMGGRGTV